MKKLGVGFIIICLSIVSACVSFSGNNKIRNLELLNEYNLLLVDLANINTYGYKSYIKSDYDEGISRASEIINTNQGGLVYTGVPTDFAIVGEGFFKIRLDNDKAGYARNGNFKIDSEGNFVTSQGYPFYENIKFDELFLPDTIHITRDGKVSVGIPESGNIVTKEVGSLLVYRVPTELLVYDKNGIYVIKNDVKYNEEVINLNTPDEEYFYRTLIHHKLLEMSNCSYMEITLRMLYILSVADDNTIKNRELKKELLNGLLYPGMKFSADTIETYYGRIYYYIGGIVQYLRADY